MGEKMRPIVFKGGLPCGKVVGIKGLYLSPTGRWYVRKSIEGVDRELTLEGMPENVTFSGLERAAKKGLIELVRRMRPDVQRAKSKAEASAVSAEARTAIERGQEAVSRYMEKVYCPSVRAVGSRRRHEMEGFAFVTKDLRREEDEIALHNVALLNERIAALEEAGHMVAAYDYRRHVQAVFSRAISYGAHKGTNPATDARKPCDLRSEDKRWVSMEESARVQAELPGWLQEHHYNDAKATEVCALHYLMTLGMRASSAIRFRADALETDPDGTIRYWVVNTKTNRRMPVSQIIEPKMVFLLRKIEHFTYSKWSLLEALNAAIPEILGKDLRAKHLRHGFITEVIASREFSYYDARRLTHKTQDIAENHYNGLSQASADAVSIWWNMNWMGHFERELQRVRWAGVEISDLAKRQNEL